MKLTKRVTWEEFKETVESKIITVSYAYETEEEYKAHNKKMIASGWSSESEPEYSERSSNQKFSVSQCYSKVLKNEVEKQEEAQK